MTILSLIMAVVSAAVSAAERPNVLVVLTDDHSVPHVGCYGNHDIRTPNLDRFAAEGMRFDRAYVTCPQCVPSRASIMTGRSPVAIQMTRFSAPLPAEIPVFPELLKAAGYYAGIARFDSDFGQIMGELAKRGLAENTIVMFMGDNGASQFRGKGTLYEYGVHVPLIIRWPGRVKPGSATAELVSGEDLAPTFLEAAGVTVPKAVTGRSFLKLLKGETFAGRRHVFAERGAHGQGLPTNSANFDLGRCVITKTHKLIYTATW